MAKPISKINIPYTEFGTASGDTTTIEYNFAFGIPEFATLSVYEEGTPSNLLSYEIATEGFLTITNDGTVPAQGTFVVIVDVPADKFVRNVKNGNIFREQTMVDLFTQVFMVAGSVAEGRLSTLAQNLDMGANKLTNMADGVDAQDAVTKAQLDDVTSSTLPVLQGMVDTATAQATASASSATASAESAVTSGEQANIATTKATEATTEADRSKTEADRSKAEADRAQSLADGLDAIGTDKIADEAVTEAKLSQDLQAKVNADPGAGSITTEKLADEAVTIGKLSTEVQGLLGGVPVAAVIPFAKQSAIPSGWLLCNGASFNGTTYPKLQTALGGTTVPDLRGEFIRGLDLGRGVDTGRTEGSAQADQMESHAHNLNPALSRSVGGSGGSPYTLGFDSGTADNNNILTDTENTGGTSNSSENRPRNIAFVYAIKAE